MELRQLRYFVAVAEAGNISRAAEKIFLTQPALSRQIKALEGEIGRCLLERQAHSIRLTPVGELLLEEARALLAHADEVLEKTRTVGLGVRLRVGYAPSLAGDFLSGAVENFTQLHPGARVELFDLSTGEMLAGLEGDKLDVVITVADGTKPRGITWTPLLRAPWRLAVGPRHGLAGRARVTPAQVAAEPLLVFCRRDYPEYHAAIEAWLGEHRLRPKIVGEYDSADSLLAAVEAGLGVALVTPRTARRGSDRLHLATITAGPAALCVAAGFRADRKDRDMLKVFAADLRNAAAVLV
jgi:LysR family transcriptional regulator, benzoate and cis,cis-muconate-responsive activator of ben and cat genes